MQPSPPSFTRRLFRQPLVMLILVSMAALLTAPVAEEWLHFFQMGQDVSHTQGVVVERQITVITDNLQIRAFTPLELRYEYDAELSDGVSATYRARAFVNRRTYQSYAPGSSIPVVYSAANPEVSVLGGDLHARLVYTITTITFIFLVVIAFRTALDTPPSIQSIVQTMTTDVEAMIQERLVGHPTLADRVIHIHAAPDLPLVIEVDGKPYVKVRDIPDDAVREFIEGIVEEWTSTQLSEAE